MHIPQHVVKEVYAFEVYCHISVVSDKNDVETFFVFLLVNAGHP